MQIWEDFETVSEPSPNKRRATAPIQRLALRNMEENETLRLPMSLLAFWRDPVDPRLETVRMVLPVNMDEDETMAGPLPD